jgi:hypothetical protein
MKPNVFLGLSTVPPPWIVSNNCLTFALPSHLFSTDHDTLAASLEGTQKADTTVTRHSCADDYVQWANLHSYQVQAVIGNCSNPNAIEHNFWNDGA